MEAGPKSLIAARIACVVITLAALFVLFQRLEWNAVTAAFRSMRPGWFIAAVVANGLAFLPAAWRWHLVLRLTGNSVHPGATMRLSLIGHFLYTVLFGAVGGDTAKAVIYARWYGRHIPSILATAPLDRLVGLFGLILFAVAALLWAGAAGAFAELQPLALSWRNRSVLIVILLCVGLLFVARRARPQSGLATFAQEIVRGVRALLRSPRLALSGTACSVLVHAALNAVLALNLQAVSHTPVPWSQIIWTFPVISVVSALPVTVAGLGTREGAALLLWGLYGVSEPTAVAASLLTLSASVIWALIGGALLWRESARGHRRRALPKTISVVIPTLNEAESLPGTLQRVAEVAEVCEIIVVDGGSSDATREIAVRFGCRVLRAPPSRGGQMRLGAAFSKGDVVMLLHADTWLPASAGKALIDCFRDGAVVGGGFWKVFHHANSLLLGSRFRCAIRLYLGRRIAGDQAIFVRRAILEQIGGVPDMPLMEEFELCRRLREAGRVALADAVVTTSARRFAKLGIVRTYVRMWIVMVRYYLGTPPQELRRLYERK